MKNCHFQMFFSAFQRGITAPSLIAPARVKSDLRRLAPFYSICSFYILLYLKYFYLHDSWILFVDSENKSNFECLNNFLCVKTNEFITVIYGSLVSEMIWL